MSRTIITPRIRAAIDRDLAARLPRQVIAQRHGITVETVEKLARVERRAA